MEAASSWREEVRYHSSCSGESVLSSNFLYGRTALVTHGLLNVASISTNLYHVLYFRGSWSLESQHSISFLAQYYYKLANLDEWSAPSALADMPGDNYLQADPTPRHAWA